MRLGDAAHRSRARSPRAARPALRATFAVERWPHLGAERAGAPRRTSARDARAPGAPRRRSPSAASTRTKRRVDAARANVNGRAAHPIRSASSEGDATQPPPLPERHGLLVTNPPYGDRLSAGGQKGMKTFYFQLGERLGSCAGWRMAMLSGNAAFESAFHRRPTSRRELWNGPIECTFLGYRPFVSHGGMPIGSEMAPREARSRRKATTASLLLFLSATLALNVTPGPAMLYVMARSAGEGRRAGIASVLGIAVGCLVDTALVVLGLSSLLLAVPFAYDAVRLCGAAYLVYLGIRALMRPSTLPESSAQLAPASHGAIFRQGVVTNVLNPKVALFFLRVPSAVRRRGARQRALAAAPARDDLQRLWSDRDAGRRAGRERRERLGPNALQGRRGTAASDGPGLHRARGADRHAAAQLSGVDRRLSGRRLLAEKRQAVRCRASKHEDALPSAGREGRPPSGSCPNE